MGKIYVKANNKYTNPDVDYYYPQEHEYDKLIKEFNECYNNDINNFDISNHFKKNYLFYIDANNLYRLSMSKYMPYNNFNWLDVNQLNYTMNYFVSWLHLIPLDSDIGYIFEVDLEYTDKELTKRFPLCPENKKVDINYFSTKQRKIIEYSEHKTIKE